MAIFPRRTMYEESPTWQRPGNTPRAIAYGIGSLASLTGSVVGFTSEYFNNHTYSPVSWAGLSGVVAGVLARKTYTAYKGGEDVRISTSLMHLMKVYKIVNRKAIIDGTAVDARTTVPVITATYSAVPLTKHPGGEAVIEGIAWDAGDIPPPAAPSPPMPET